MAATVAWSSMGAKLEVSIASAFAEILGIRTLKLSGVNREFADITNISSDGNFEEIFPILNRSTETTFDMVWDPTDSVHDALVDSALASDFANQKLSFRFTSNDTGAATLAFSAYVSKMEPDISQASVQMLSIGLKVTGAQTYTQ